MRPSVRWEGEAEPEFQKRIKAATERISFDSDDFQPWEREVYRIARRYGHEVAVQRLDELRRLRRNSPELQAQSPPISLWFSFNLGDLVFRAAGRSLAPLLKSNDVQFYLFGHEIIGHFKHLKSRSYTRFKPPARYSPLGKKYLMWGRQYTLSFSDHFYDNLHTRLLGQCTTYFGHGDVFSLLYDCHPVSPCKIMDEKREKHVRAVSLFKPLSPVTDERLPIDNMTLAAIRQKGFELRDDGTGLFVRVGYCPLIFKGDMAIAKSFLCPGYGATPEAALYESTELPTETKRWAERVGTDDSPFDGLLHTHPVAAALFHVNGHPQFVLGSDPCLVHPTDSSS